MSRMAAIVTVDADDFAVEMDVHRRELTGYCYRMLGAGSEAEDAVQETFLRAWRARDRFAHRSTLKTWLYKIATNVCLDMPQRPQRRARPMDLVSPSTCETAVLHELPESRWVQPIADARVLSGAGDPAELAAQRDSVRLAFVAALQALPPRQRSVLILREVLHMSAAEVAELLDTTVASVNSALQRARASIGDRPVVADEAELDADDRELLTRYVDTFERYDIDSLVSLLREDAVSAMPPHELWLQGPEEIHRWMLGPGIACKGGRLVATRANGCPAFGSYRVDPDGGWSAWSLQVLEIKDGRILTIHNYLNTEVLEEFGLPAHLDAEP
jgi:RNA polymerase sigma-70 factor (ECF subfamily)